jgi:predicted ATPase
MPSTYYAVLGLAARFSIPEIQDRGLAGRFRTLVSNQPDRREIIQEYLRAIAPPFDRLEVVEFNGLPWLQFIEKTGSGPERSFYLPQVSAGLLNAAEILLELFETPENGKPASVVVIEEPEALLHPGAIHVMCDSFLEASRTRQVLVTTHSPDLLDDSAIPAECIRVVYKNESGTHVSALDAATESVIRDQLYTPGQLMRQGGLVVNS